MEKYIIYIAGDPDAYPLEYYDHDAGAYRGVIPELLKQFSAQSQYDVRYYAPEEGDQRMALAENQQVDLISCPEDIEAVPHRRGEDILLLDDDGAGQAAVFCLLDVAPDGLAGELRSFLSGVSQREMTAMVIRASQDVPLQNRHLQRGVFAGMTLVIAILLAVLFFVIFSSRRKRKRLDMSQEQDPVTGIGNREYLERCSRIYLKDENRVLYTLFYFYLDLETAADGAEKTMGLRHVAAVLQNYASDTDVLARVSDEGFALLRLTPNMQEASQWLSAVFSRLREGTEGYMPGITAGAYPLKMGDRDLNEILFFGLLAAQNARKSGEDFWIFSDEIMRPIMEDRRLRADIRVGLENREFKIYLQFCVEASTGRVVGAETSILWEHPEKGVLPVSRWLQLVEEEGLAGQLDSYVFWQLCAILDSLRRKGKTDLFLICPLLGGPGSLEHIVAECKTLAQIPACGQLLFSVPRDTVLSASEAEALRTLGAGLVLEDFSGQLDGLMQNEDVRLCGLSLHLELAKGMDTPRGRAVLESLFQMGRKLELFFLAKDVSSEEQAACLRELGASLLCGTLYAHPLPAWEAVKDLESS